MAYFRCGRKALFYKAFKKVFSHRFYTFPPFIKIIEKEKGDGSLFFFKRDFNLTKSQT
jgi:hypothetical protein